MKKYEPGQIVTLLRQIEVEIANGKDHPTSLPGRRDHGADVLALEERVWRAEAGQGQETQVERKNAKLKRLVAESSLEKQF